MASPENTLLRLVGHCEGDPCMNGATCNEVRDGYECICPTGFKGTDCEGLGFFSILADIFTMLRKGSVQFFIIFLLRRLRAFKHFYCQMSFILP